MNLLSLRIFDAPHSETSLGIWESGDVKLFPNNIWDAAARIAYLLQTLSVYEISKDLFALTVFHELYHAGKPRDNEKKADDYAWNAFKLMYKRVPCFPRKYWRKLPK